MTTNQQAVCTVLCNFRETFYDTKQAQHDNALHTVTQHTLFSAYQKPLTEIV